MEGLLVLAVVVVAALMVAGGGAWRAHVEQARLRASSSRPTASAGRRRAWSSRRGRARARGPCPWTRQHTVGAVCIGIDLPTKIVADVIGRRLHHPLREPGH